MKPLFRDIFEPPEVDAMLKPVAGSCIPAPLNSNGWADYKWEDITGKVRCWERKQTGEALSDLDGVEEQLNRELRNCDELVLVVEGIGLPTPDGVQCFKQCHDGRFFHAAHKFTHQPGLWRKYCNWKWGLRMAGIAVVQTASLCETCSEIAACYIESNKAERTTLRRYVQPHIPPFDPDPQIDNLCRIKTPKGTSGIGVERAVRLMEMYGSMYGAITAPEEELSRVLGPKVADSFMKAVGRR